MSGFVVGLKYYGEIFNFDIAYTKPDKASSYIDKDSENVYVTVGVKF